MDAADPIFFLRVERVNEGCQVPVGHSSGALHGVATVGRGADVDFRLSDATVSGHHLSVERAGDSFVITSHSAHGTTFVDREPVVAKTSVTVVAEAVWIQVGRVLLALSVAPATLPVSEPMTLPPTSTPTAPILVIRALGHRFDVLCVGQPIALYPSAARVLQRLAASCGDVVAHGDLLDVVDPDLGAGGSSIAQLVTYIRHALAEAIAAGWLTEARLRAEIVPAPRVPPPDQRALLRLVVENVRGVGYRLRLDPNAVQTR